MREDMQPGENENTWKHRITQKVKTKTSVFKVSFMKAHPVSCQLHPEYPTGNFIQLTFNSPYRYTRTPPHIFTTETELDHFLSTYT